jgi:hypothetical protein
VAQVRAAGLRQFALRVLGSKLAAQQEQQRRQQAATAAHAGEGPAAPWAARGPPAALPVVLPQGDSWSSGGVARSAGDVGMQRPPALGAVV